MKKLLVLSSLLFAGAALAATPADTYVIQQAGDIPTLDPESAYDTASSGIIANLYETLVSYPGASLTKLEPRLATKWSITNNGKTYTFDLRKGVKFHNGDTFTCADAEYTFRRNLVINGGESGQWFLAEGLLGTPSNGKDDKNVTWAKISNAVKCNAAGQLVFTLPKVDPAFLAKLAFPGQAIVSKEYTTKLGDWSGTEKDWKDWAGKEMQGSALSKAPNGTGPYKLVRQDANTMLFTAFDGYWGKKPSIKNVIRQKVPELAARQQALLRGDADRIEGASRTVDEAQIKGKPGVTWVDDLPNTSAPAIFMNWNIKGKDYIGSGKLDGKGIPANFFTDVNVRRAFSYAFNYDQFAQDVYKGKATQRTMALPDSFPGYNAKVKKYEFDPKKAAEAFKKAWGGDVWKNGFVLNAAYRANTPTSQIALEILKKNVEAINPKFKINIQPKQWSDLLKERNAGELPMLLISWAPDYADPDNFINTFYGSTGFYASGSSIKDAQIDAWNEQARTSVNATIRNNLYTKIGNRAYDQALYILMPAPVGWMFYSDRITGEGLTKATYNPMTDLEWSGLTKK
ncbi:ABC transporter substrate-binding protein [Deinococcus antarcticus]|uniref:ABC transporter substrate-binding protein n=1 Tax=Deinococcus antarcticus TaxID=1298767 RepID=A0ABV8A244_9DEIO